MRLAYVYQNNCVSGSAVLKPTK